MKNLKTKHLLIILLLLQYSVVYATCNTEISDKKKSENNMSNNIIELPEPKYNSNVSIEKTLLTRRSIRTYKTEPLELTELSQLLWAAYGITEKVEQPAFLRGGLRTAPSAGALVFQACPVPFCGHCPEPDQSVPVWWPPPDRK